MQHGCTVAKNCIAIGNGLYCREGGLMAELYCNTIGCIGNKRLLRIVLQYNYCIAT